jgi:tetratricopeptide (TPR) repeat protein
VEAIPLSDLSTIKVDAGQTPSIAFLPEPEHTWCYYYAKAELAYQQGDWHQVMASIEEARSLGYAPEDPFEWLGYIEAQARLGNIEAAERVSREAIKEDSSLRKGLCEVWQRIHILTPVGNESERLVNQTLSAFECK